MTCLKRVLYMCPELCYSDIGRALHLRIALLKRSSPCDRKCLQSLDCRHFLFSPQAILVAIKGVGDMRVKPSTQHKVRDKLYYDNIQDMLKEHSTCVNCIWRDKTVKEKVLCTRAECPHGLR